jgi:hypothetical protein
MEQNGTWKERNSRHPYHALLQTVNATSTVTSNWHGVPTAKEALSVVLSEEFVAQRVIPPHSARVVVSFKDKLTGDSARNWIAEVAAKYSFQMEIQKFFPSGFHLVHIFGPEANAARDTLLVHSPINNRGWYATFSPLLDNTNLDRQVGLKQLIHVMFTSALPWLEDSLDKVF